MPLFVMMIGIPGSGKSTWVQDFLQKIPLEEKPNWIVASSDDYIEMKASQEGKTYSEVFIKYRDAAERVCNETINFAIDNDVNIILDRTNLTKKDRKKRMALIPDHYKKFFCYMPAPRLSELEKRLKTRPGKHIPFEVLLNMVNSTEPPDLSEGFEARIS